METVRRLECEPLLSLSLSLSTCGVRPYQLQSESENLGGHDKQYVGSLSLLTGCYLFNCAYPCQFSNTRFHFLPTTLEECWKHVELVCQGQHFVL